MYVYHIPLLQRIAKQHLAKLPIPTSEQLAPGHKSEWKLWKSLNRLRTCMGRSKSNLSKWGYADTADTACECGTSEQTMQHLLRCPLLENECSLEDLATANEKALHCARAWPNIWLNSEMMDTKEEHTIMKPFGSAKLSEFMKKFIPPFAFIQMFNSYEMFCRMWLKTSP